MKNQEYRKRQSSYRTARRVLTPGSRASKAFKSAAFNLACPKLICFPLACWPRGPREKTVATYLSLSMSQPFPLAPDSSPPSRFSFGVSHFFLNVFQLHSRAISRDFAR